MHRYSTRMFDEAATTSFPRQIVSVLRKSWQKYIVTFTSSHASVEAVRKLGQALIVINSKSESSNE